MTTQAEGQAFELGPTQDFSQVWWQSKNNFGMMLENECLCTLFEMFFWKKIHSSFE
jgi:hypothetical protein